MSNPLEDWDRRKDTIRCPECEGELERRGETACTECGLVVDGSPVTVDYQNSPALRFSNDLASPTNPALKDQGLLTNIDSSAELKAFENGEVSRGKRIHQLRKWQARLRETDSKEQNLNVALNEIHRMASALGLPETLVQTVSVLYRRAFRENLVEGWSIEDISTASLYLACRLDGIPRTVPEITRVARTPESKINNAYRYLKRELNIPIKPVHPSAYLPRFCSKLDLDARVEKVARDILDCCDGEFASGNSPIGLAASAIYVAAEIEGEKRTQQEVGEKAGVSYQTISERSRDLRRLFKE